MVSVVKGILRRERRWEERKKRKLPFLYSPPLKKKIEEKTGLKELINYVNEVYERTGAKREVIESFKKHKEIVLKYAIELAKKEKITSKELEILKAAAILHDVSKLGNKDKDVPLVKHGWESAAMAKEKLRELGKDEEFIEAVTKAIERHMGPIPGFMAEQAKRWEEKTGEKIIFPRPETLVEKILYDADMLTLIHKSGIERILTIRETTPVFVEEDRKVAKKEGITQEQAALKSALQSAKEAVESLFTHSAKEIAKSFFFVLS